MMKQQFTELVDGIEVLRVKLALIAKSGQLPPEYGQTAGMLTYHLLAARRAAKEVADALPNTMALG